MPISFRKAAAAFAAFTLATTGTAVLAQTHDVMILDQAFFPAVIYVEAGDTITFTNSSDGSRTVKAADDSWQSETLSKGSSFSYVIDPSSPLRFTSSAGQGGDAYEGAISFDEPPLSE
jgi:plastocyanin